ncbi:MAG: 3-dehydroquinate synthase, partial [Pseudomonadota bacterium]
ADEREAGQRALLNLGHTFGHALEAEMGYTGALLHGEAVAIGMAMAFRFSARLGHVSGPDATRVTAHLEAMGLPTHLSFLQERARGLTANRLLHHIAQDKKVEAGRLTFILTRGIGAAFIEKDVSADAVATFLDTEIQ